MVLTIESCVCIWWRLFRDHERKLNPNSPHLKRYIENEVPKPDIKSDKEKIREYLEYYRIPYRDSETKKRTIEKD